LKDGKLIAERPDAAPNPTVEVASCYRTVPTSKLFGLIFARVVSPSL
jgi:hypothetical protein